jgi:hypothetical protein
MAESASRTIDTDTQLRRVREGGFATITHRLRARRAQKRYAKKELKAWLQITANPLW